MIIRTVRKETFTSICNDLLNDVTISFKAKGLLCYLISRPPNWNANVNHISTTFKEGKDAIYSIITELIEAGYIKRFRLKNSIGRNVGIEYHVHETKQPQGEIPKVENHEGEKPGYNKDGSIINKEDSKGAGEPAAKIPIEKEEEVIRYRKVLFLKLVIDWIKDNQERKYPKLMFVDFAKYWLEQSIHKKKTKLRFEGQEYFDVGRRLSTWFQKVSNLTTTEYWEKESSLPTINDLFKKLL